METLDSKCLYYNKSRRIRDQHLKKDTKRTEFKVQHYLDRGCYKCSGYDFECSFYINQRNLIELKRGYKNVETSKRN